MSFSLFGQLVLARTAFFGSTGSRCLVCLHALFKPFLQAFHVSAWHGRGNGADAIDLCELCIVPAVCNVCDVRWLTHRAQSGSSVQSRCIAAEVASSLGRSCITFQSWCKSSAPALSRYSEIQVHKSAGLLLYVVHAGRHHRESS